MHTEIDEKTGDVFIIHPNYEKCRNTKDKLVAYFEHDIHHKETLMSLINDLNECPGEPVNPAIMNAAINSGYPDYIVKYDTRQVFYKTIYNTHYSPIDKLRAWWNCPRSY